MIDSGSEGGGAAMDTGSASYYECHIIEAMLELHHPDNVSCNSVSVCQYRSPSKYVPRGARAL